MNKGLYDKNKVNTLEIFSIWFRNIQVKIYAEVVTCVAGSLEAGGLTGYPECLVVEINVMKS